MKNGSVGLQIIHDTPDVFPGANKPVAQKDNVVATNAKLYAHWVNCIGMECSNGHEGHCCTSSKDFPDDGKCLKPGCFEYDAKADALGAYETEEEWYES
jgi:hypothetical protein